MDFFSDSEIYPEIFSDLRIHLHKAEEELIVAHENNDWKLIKSLADREREGTFYCGARRLRYACQFLEGYCESNHSNLLEALYEQALNVMVQTRKAIGKD
ncbi:MAG: hypothetical protein H0U70_01080 [Tatlockia sp.]|nr:hypothetical protein [Tatlockia sp.]